MPAFDSNALETPVRLAITDWHMLFPLILIAGKRTISPGRGKVPSVCPGRAVEKAEEMAYVLRHA